MVAFAARRLVGALLVLIAVSFITYLIFIKIPGGNPATFSLCIGAAIIWLAFGILVGVISAVTAGRLSDRVITILALIGISMPVFWLGIISRYYLAEGGLGT